MWGGHGLPAPHSFLNPEPVMNGARGTLLLLPIVGAALLSACGTEPIDETVFTGRVGGCANFQVYRFDPETTSALVVRGKGPQLNLGGTPREFALPDPALEVRIDRFAVPAPTYYCDDVGGDPEPVRTWTAVSGTVRIAAVDTLAVQPWGTEYNIAVTLHDVTLRDGNGREVYLRKFDFGVLLVGWLPG